MTGVNIFLEQTKRNENCERASGTLEVVILSVICQLKPDSHMPPTYLDTVTAYVNIYRRIIIDPRLAYVFAGAPWPALLDDLAAMKIILYVNIHSV